MNELSRLLYDYLIKIGISDENALMVNIFLLSVISLLGLFLIDYISKKIIRVVFINFARKSKSKFDDILISNKTPTVSYTHLTLPTRSYV